MSGKLFNFLCSQLERKNSRRTIDLSVNLIFRRIHVYQNDHVPIYRFPSVFFIFFSQKEFFMLTNGTTYQTANRLDRFVGFELLVMCYFYIASFNSVITRAIFTKSSSSWSKGILFSIAVSAISKSTVLRIVTPFLRHLKLRLAAFS